jgi:SAM-dependent methyltransferase
VLLTERLGLSDQLTHRLGSALDLSIEDGSFDVVWTQNSGMQIEDKARLYAELRRALRPGGRLAIQEPLAGPVQPPIYPLMWARDASQSFLLPPAELLVIIEGAGFRMRAWSAATPAAARAASSVPTIQRLVMGDALDAILAAGQRNAEEGRLVTMDGLFDRP